MAPTEELEAEGAELKLDFERERAYDDICDFFRTDNGVTVNTKTEDAEWHKILEESVSETEKNPSLKSLYDELIRNHGSLCLALAYRLAKLLSNYRFNCRKLFLCFLGPCSDDPDIRAEIINDLSAARVRYVPNRSHVETLLCS